MSEQIDCPICETKAQEEPRTRDGKHILCPKCGEYFISGSVLSKCKYDDAKPILPKISSWISEQNKIYDTVPEILTDTAAMIEEQKDKTIKEKFDCFMRTIQHLPTGGLNANTFNHCYIQDNVELGLFFEKALEKNYLKGHSKQMRAGGMFYFTSEGITFDGLEYIESLSQTNENSNNIFVAFHFTKEMQYIFDNDIKLAIEELGFNYVRVSSSTTDTDTHINDDIIGKIKSSKMVIADFTGQRNSVYFEAGFAMGLNIPVIWTCKNEEVSKLSFDTRQYPHILWDNKEDFVDSIKNRIKALI